MQPDLGLESVTPRTHPIRPAPAVDKEERRTSCKDKVHRLIEENVPILFLHQGSFPH